MQLTWIGLLFVLLTPLTAVAQAVAERLTVVELFTSQGCASCPPADAFLGELSKRPDILALSEHVDYWDYLGWPDPLASYENTRRQRAYARRLGIAYVYTPQIVVQGAMHTSGADRDQVHRLIAQARALPAISLAFYHDEAGALLLQLGEVPQAEPMDVWLVHFESSRVTTVAKGENGGRKMTNYNVVRDFTRIASWNGAATTMPIQEAAAAPEGADAAVLVQQQATGRIVGAARMQSSHH